jgi:dTDP-4-amino-4,6-dideoxygalactose transaminase
VIAVHWGGYPCALDQLNSICEEFGGKLIEDAAHAFGATYKGRMVGTDSDFACFSFQAIKHLTTVDGGALLCRDEDAYRRGKLLRWYGIDRECKRQDFRCEADIADAGTKWHMNDVCATIGIEQMKTVRDVIRAHRENAAYYNAEFEARGIKTVRPLLYEPDRESSYWLYTVLAVDRDRFVKWMNDHGVMCSRVHQRNDIHTYAKPYYSGPLPGVDLFAAHEACIPVGWWLSEDDRMAVMDMITAWDRR